MIQWQDKRAVAFRISSPAHDIDAVRLAGASQAIAGTHVTTNDTVVFTPLIPFTRGLDYEIWITGKLSAVVHIPEADPSQAPRVLAVYPSSDTVPENLLKLYIVFSAPMREDQSAAHIRLLTAAGDTIKGAFLDLQSELWNENRTQLTIWFDPGRIKRDLQPNRSKGTPMSKDHIYTVLIDAGWPDVQGRGLKLPYSKKYFATVRDGQVPDPRLWKISPHRAGTKRHIRITFPEPLDFGLLTSVIQVMDQHEAIFPGVITVAKNERSISFTPSVEWSDSRYSLRVGARLEDLAGNNCNRLFDRDVHKDKEIKEVELITVAIP